MSDAWYCAEVDLPVGPISILELKRILHRLKNWKERLVWHSSFNDWCKAGQCRILQQEPTCYGTMRRAASACASTETARNHLFLCIAFMATSDSSGLVSRLRGRSRRLE
jgi:hypothetical protein